MLLDEFKRLAKSLPCFCHNERSTKRARYFDNAITLKCWDDRLKRAGRLGEPFKCSLL